LLHGAWTLLLARYGGSREVVSGAVVSARPPGLPGNEEIVGPLINTVPLRLDVPPAARVDTWLREVQRRLLAVIEHQHPGLPRIRSWSGVPAGQPLFEGILSFQNYPDSSWFREHHLGLAFGGLRFSVRTGYPVTVVAGLGERLLVRVTYRRDRVDPSVAGAVAGHLQTLLEGFLADPMRRLGRLELLRPEERRRLVASAAAPEPVRGEVFCLHHRLAAVARATPDAPAVSCEDRLLTYRDLDRRSNRLAHALVRRGVAPGDTVGICLERSERWAAAILGALKAGAAYLPLDPGYPRERLELCLGDAGVRVVISEEGAHDRLPEDPGRTVLRLDADEPEDLPCHDPEAPAWPESAAYVMYTSGSTGRPKAITVSHANVARLFTGTEHWFRSAPDDVWTLFHSFAFDFSVWEIWGALLYGGRLAVVPFWATRSPRDLCRLLLAEGVTVLSQTPSAFRQLMAAEAESGERRQRLALRCVVFGGEALEPAALRPWVARHGARGPRLINMYGITETTVHVTYRPLLETEVERGVPSVIGGPIPDLETHVLDPWGEPCPLSVAGEMVVGGAGVTRGYRRPGLTAAAFVPDHLSGRPGDRLYRSGDLARRLPGGDLQFLGRLDHQVKVRGFRIEPGEIETALAAHPRVAGALVLLRADPPGEPRLVAYVVPRRGVPAPNTEDLRGFLAGELPPHMIPAAFVALDELPLTRHGKVDRDALPAPSGERPELERSFEAPDGRVEEILARIWSEVLGVSPVGRHDNFFSLGGDSMQSIKVLAKARAEGLDLSIEHIFSRQTVAGIARAVGRDLRLPSGASRAPFSLVSDADRARMPPEVEDAYPIARLQAGMLFHGDYDRDTVTYHDVFSYHVRMRLEHDLLRDTFRRIMENHPILRACFELTRFSEPLQVIYRSCPVPLETGDLSHLPAEEQEEAVTAGVAREKQNKLDWTRAPLFRLRADHRGEESFQLTFSFHHAILDGWSVASMLGELLRTYAALRDGRPGDLPAPPRALFRDFVALERETLESPESQRFWQRTLEAHPGTRLPRLRPAEAEDQESRMHVLRFPAATASALLGLSRSFGLPLKSLLLAVHVRLLAFLSGDHDVVTGAGINSRPESEDGERILGVLVTVLPLRLRVPRGSWLDLARRCFEAERELMPHRRLPLAEIQRLLDRGPLFEAVFNFTHFHVLGDALGVRDDLLLLGRTFFQETSFTLVSYFDLNPATSELTLLLEYDPAHLNAPQVRRLSAGYHLLVTALADDPFAATEELSLLSRAERQALLREWNDVEGAAAEEAALYGRFHDRARAAPDAVALVFDGSHLSFGTLDARARVLARRLRELGVGRETPVGIFLDASPEAVTALVAGVAAGAAYVPLDLAYPRERLARIVADAELSFVVTGSKRAPGLRDLPIRPVLVEEATAPTGGALPWEAPAEAPGQLAYVMYTSGSTGAPKGVGVPRRAIVELTAGARYVEIRPTDRIAQAANLAFDAATFEIWGALLNGACIVGIPKEVALHPPELARRLRREAVTVLFLTTALFNQVAREEPRAFRTLHHLLFGGEAVNPIWVRRVLEAGPPGRLLHVYGPTECTTFASWHPVADVPADATSVPIGRPIARTELHVLGRDLAPVPPGATGELFIGGTRLARGYHRQGGPTAERFVPSPLPGAAGERLYRTGDQVRRLADGGIEFLGRIDQQVKLRGFRIELGEIEAELRGARSVRDAVVVVREDTPGDRRLVAYVAAEPESSDGSDWEADRIREWRRIYADLYGGDASQEAPAPLDPALDITGWQSSYDGRALLEHEMAEWLESRVARLRRLAPRRVLEIGCGTGMLLFRIAPGCERYVATDFSRPVLHRLARHTSDLPQVTLLERTADDFSGLEPGSFDLVILNSVVQYFPSLDYLLEVLAATARASAPGGTIYLGDLRNHELLEAFHTAVQLYQAPADLPVPQLRQRIQKRIAQEQELTIHPDLFGVLGDRVPGLAAAEIHLTRGRHRNELTRFRYDSLLHLAPGPPTPPAPAELDWERDGLSLAALRGRLSGAAGGLVVRRVPNARVAEEVAAARRIGDPAADGLTAADLVAGVVGAGGVDPEDLWALGEDAGYEASVGWSRSGEGRMDAWFLAPDGDPRRRPAVPMGTAGGRPLTALVNDPLQGRAAAQMIPRLRSLLETRLPEYMVPATFVLLDELPLTPNGKVNRAALPVPDRQRPDLEVRYEAPRDAVEVALAEIWSRVLGVERVGVHDNFFDLGGDSILSILIIALAHESGLELTPRELFEHPTLAELAPRARSTAQQRAEQGPVTGELPLTPIQRWFFEQDPPRPEHFNQAMLFTPRRALPAACLDRALAAVVAHHDALRLRFSRAGGDIAAELAPLERSDVLCRVDLARLPPARVDGALEDAATAVQRSLDLERGPLLRAGLFDLPHERGTRLLLAIHHLAVDVYSWRVILEDLTAAFGRLADGEGVRLPAKTTSYKEWAERLREHTRTALGAGEILYWEEQLRAAAPTPASDFRGGANRVVSARVIETALDAETTRRLLREVPAAHGTEINDALLSALARSLRRSAGGRSVALDLEGHGREPLFTDVDLGRTVGWFTSLFPVRLELPDDADPVSALHVVRAQLRSLPAKGLEFGLLRHLDEEGRRRLAAFPAPAVSFNYLGQMDRAFHGDLLGPAGEAIGPLRDPRGARAHAIEINARVLDGELRVTWIYSEDLHARETIERLAEDFLQALRELVLEAAHAEGEPDPVAGLAGGGIDPTRLESILAELEAADLAGDRS
jgi:amino acid adenylation domain-containing protein/non-ribosomal peptide synthase protein (TIGR01720 family)